MLKVLEEVFMRRTSSKTFIIYFLFVLIIAVVVVFNRIYPFQTSRINLSYKSDTIKVIDKILIKKLSFKEALFYESANESSSQ